MPTVPQTHMGQGIAQDGASSPSSVKWGNRQGCGVGPGENCSPQSMARAVMNAKEGPLGDVPRVKSVAPAPWGGPGIPSSLEAATGPLATASVLSAPSTKHSQHQGARLGRVRPCPVSVTARTPPTQVPCSPHPQEQQDKVH